MKRRLIPVAALVVSLGLAGCSGDDEPKKSSAPSETPKTSASTSESKSPSALTSQSPSLDVPEMPSAAQERTKEGAVAFIEFYFQQVNAAYQEPDTAPVLATWSTPVCKSCKSIMADIAAEGGKGFSTNGDLYSLKHLGTNDDPKQAKVLLPFTLVQEAVDFVDSNGKVDGSTSRKELKRIAAVKWVNNAWALDGLAEQA